MNTAEARKAAAEAAKRLDWKRAADLLDLAIANYPRPYPKLGAFAELDISKMAERAKSYRSALLDA